MLASISPLGERARASRWWLTVSAYVLGSAVGGAAVGATAGLLVGLLPELPLTVTATVLAALFALGVLADRRAWGLSLPTVRRQVSQSWVGRYRGWVTGVGYGVQLGLGVVTIVTSATVYAVVLLAGLSGHPLPGAAVGLTFGVARALPVVGLVRSRDRAALHRVFLRLERGARPADRAAQASLAAGAVALAAVAAVSSASGTPWVAPGG